MANLVVDITSNILSQNTICFDAKKNNPELIPLPIDNANFGILNFTAVTAEETSEELDFLFVVDCSGSMSDACADGRSKMQHIIHTLKNMILFFHEHPNIKINVTINAFDTQIYSVISRTKITQNNLNEIITNIEKIVPRDSTNIEFALIKSAEEISKLQTEFPTNVINHIFMTDGEATDGSNDIDILKNIINPNITNTFIGFGNQHDAILLNGISSVGKSAYYFIDKLESAGLVYGEILHGIIYKLIQQAEITIENGLIYNFKTNTWVHSLPIGDIVSEANKIYNIASSNPHECRVNIKGHVNDLIMLFPSTLIESIDLSIQIYRQRTLQLLYEINQFCNKKHNHNELNDYRILYFIRNTNNTSIQVFEDEKKTLKLKLSNFLEEIKKYMIDNNLEENKILKNLCDDIYVCFRTFATRFGTMYCTARQTSQGTQRQYTASSVGITQPIYTNKTIRFNTITPSIPILNRQNNAFIDDNLTEEFGLTITQHTMSDFVDTPYLTPQATQVMREINRPISEDYEYDFETQL
jgi:hypothetical protein